MNAALLQEVTQIVSDVLDVPCSDLNPDSSPESVDSWDSISHLTLILSVEQACNVSFSPDQIPELTTIRSYRG